MLALAVTGLAGAGVAALPMDKAIEIHKNHIGPDSKLPQQAMKGQNNSLDHLLKNQERWVAGNHTLEPDNDLNEAAEAPETD